MKLLKKLFTREPDFIIGTKENPYLLRWWIIPRNRFFNIYLHKFLRNDDDRALHDHPWPSCSIILKGGYIEHTPGKVHIRKPKQITFRNATQAHRIELYADSENAPFAYKSTLRPAWTLFITGPRVREWGFHCPKGWRHWKDFTAPENSGLVGKGCDD